MRKTKIIATIGPKTDSLEMIRKLAEADINVARINMSHADRKYAKQIIERVRQVNSELDSNISILLDTQGPEIRTSKLSEDVDLKEGDLLRISVDSVCDTQEDEISTSVNYENILHDVNKGDTLLIDDGLVACEIVEITRTSLTCKVLNEGKLGSRKAVNLPGVKVNTPTITKKDSMDIDFGIKEDVDFIALSFVREKEDVVKLRKKLDEHGSRVQIISKIEELEGLKNIREIIKASDGVMVARGDLGVEIPMEDVPIVQKRIVDRAQIDSTPVIVATHLLESMVDNPRPTRAEVSDVATAAFQAADAIMLSAETTKGKYPLEAVQTMDRIARRVELEQSPKAVELKKAKSVKHAITKDACITSETLGAKAILVFTNTGKLARLVAKNRPTTDIIAFTPDEHVRRRCSLVWGVSAYSSDFNRPIEEIIEDSEKRLVEKKILSKGDFVVVVSDISPIKEDVDVLQVRRIAS